MSDLKPCPFCGSNPQVDKYIVLIKIYCPNCATVHRSVEVFGDGHYSQWAREQKADENGLVKISSELNPVSDIEVFNRLAAKWNERA